MLKIRHHPILFFLLALCLSFVAGMFFLADVFAYLVPAQGPGAVGALAPDVPTVRTFQSTLTNVKNSLDSVDATADALLWGIENEGAGGGFSGFSKGGVRELLHVLDTQGGDELTSSQVATALDGADVTAIRVKYNAGLVNNIEYFTSALARVEKEDAGGNDFRWVFYAYAPDNTTAKVVTLEPRFSNHNELVTYDATNADEELWVYGVDLNP